MQASLEWAQKNFGGCQLGDKRRTRRLVQVAADVADNPSTSFPDQMSTWGDLKAAYRLFNGDDVTFEAVARPHWELVKRVSAGRYLVIGDTTELDFGVHRDLPDLGPTGNGGGWGFLLHNALLVAADSQEFIGVAGQTIHYRPRKTDAAAKKEHSAARLKRKRESDVWGIVIDQAGPPPEHAEWIHVLDRGADHFEVYCHLRQQRCGWVVRAAQLERRVLTDESKTPLPLSRQLRRLEPSGSYELSLRARPQQPARTAQLQVRVGAILMPVPRHRSPWVRQLDPQPIPMNVVHVEEVDPPAGVDPICWTLLTSLPIASFDDAWTVIEYYESRWLVEEYHKALKTGCRVADRQLKTAHRLEAMVGLMSVAAVRLLQLKSLARTSPDVPAHRAVPPAWLQMLKAARKGLNRVHDLTVGQFYREVAKLGGFLGRKGDGEPGWITIWRGWEKLNHFVHGATLASKINLKE